MSEFVVLVLRNIKFANLLQESGNLDSECVAVHFFVLSVDKTKCWFFTETRTGNVDRREKLGIHASEKGSKTP